ncbi:hypothetical protein [Rhizobium sp. BK176]|uniref:hypothetical protein n=1 Tax=Rhizobium sp. BK176 TaxID=2587071 RepID=UPI00216A908C|nr:hypothetical protein [Rhizobium sp. BK176]MCS4089558.1 hypothetical protein [Rhizobium sp. BK176]
MASGQIINDQAIRDIPWQAVEKALSRRDRHLGFLNVLLTALFAAAVGLMFVQMPPQQLAMFRLMIGALWLASMFIDTMELASFVKSVRALLPVDAVWRLPTGATARFIKAEARSLRFDMDPGKVSISYKTVRDEALKADLSAKTQLGKGNA